LGNNSVPKTDLHFIDEGSSEDESLVRKYYEDHGIDLQIDLPIPEKPLISSP